jgi:KDEL-tailed cysteine endopeptidase
MENAICCPDKEHCCPENLPVCDVDEGRCLPKQGSGIMASAPWAVKVPATRKAQAGWWSSRKNEQTQSIKVAAT